MYYKIEKLSSVSKMFSKVTGQYKFNVQVHIYELSKT